MNELDKDIKDLRVLISEEEIQSKLKTLANEIEKVFTPLEERNKGYAKSSKTTAILGCDWKTLKLHIERQFTKNMTWENRSEWHIDHIVPLASANTEEELIALNHYTNLRPMWAEDNLSKGAKMEFLIWTTSYAHTSRKP